MPFYENLEQKILYVSAVGSEVCCATNEDTMQICLEATVFT